MTREQAKSELMQIYMSLSEEKKQALDVLMAQADEEKTCGTCRNEDTYHCAECENKSDYEQAQADGEYINREDTLNAIIKRLGISSERYLLESERVIYQQILAMPSVAIPPEHDGCKDCKYETYPDYYYPCCDCKQNYVDEWQKKPHWNHGGGIPMEIER